MPALVVPLGGECDMDPVTIFVWFLAFCGMYLIMYNLFLRALLDDDDETTDKRN